MSEVSRGVALGIGRKNGHFLGKAARVIILTSSFKRQCRGHGMYHEKHAKGFDVLTA